MQWALAHALREERMKRDLTHAEAAAAIGVAQRTYSSWESAEKRPGDQYLDAICGFLDKPINTVVLLLHGLPDNTPHGHGRQDDTDARDTIIMQHLATLTAAVTRLSKQMDTFERGSRTAPAKSARPH